MFINSEHGVLFLHVTKACGMSIKATLERTLRNENQLRVRNLLRDLWDGTLLQSLYFHLDGQEVIRHFPEANATCHTFVGVRNPYDRAYSLYQYVQDKALRLAWVAYLVFVLALLVAILVLGLMPDPWGLVVGAVLLAALLCVVGYLLVVNNGFRFLAYNLTDFPGSCGYLRSLMRSHSSLFGTNANYCRGLRVDTVLYEEDFPANFERLLDRLGLPAAVKSVNIGKTGHEAVASIQRHGETSYRYLDQHTPETIRQINDLYAEDFEIFGFARIEPDELDRVRTGRLDVQDRNRFVDRLSRRTWGVPETQPLKTRAGMEK